VAYAQKGEGDRALASLERALSRGIDDVASIRSDTALAPIAADARFSALLERKGATTPR
jgi:hypothetical protein